MRRICGYVEEDERREYFYFWRVSLLLVLVEKFVPIVGKNLFLLSIFKKSGGVAKNLFLSKCKSYMIRDIAKRTVRLNCFIQNYKMNEK